MSHMFPIFNTEEPGAVTITVTPKIAEYILDTMNTGNRPIKKGVVMKYSKIMEDGNWRFSPETISVSKSGKLLNGQHRLLAVVNSGMTAKFLFATGFDDDVFSVLDRGATRTRSDALGINKKLAEAGALLARLEIKTVSLITDNDVLAASERIRVAHDELIERAPTSARLFGSTAFRLAASARMMQSENREYVLSLYRDLVLGHTENLPPIAHVAIRYYMSGNWDAKSAGGHKQSIHVCAAWDLFDEGSKMKKRLKLAYNPKIADQIVEAVNNG